MKRDAIDRFMSKCRRAENGCLEWTGALQTKGYGSFGPGGKSVSVLAHRWIWEHEKGPIHEGHVIDHLCSNRKCQDTSHMRTCFAGENTMATHSQSPSAVNARRSICKHGHPLEGANLRVRPNGRRQCRACDAELKKRYRSQKTAVAP